MDITHVLLHQNQIDDAIAGALAHPGPALVEIITDPTSCDEVDLGGSGRAR
jgi:thiamine pyrophosphate-dependent acetolactate synthase large subunit-like protein